MCDEQAAGSGMGCHGGTGSQCSGGHPGQGVPCVGRAAGRADRVRARPPVPATRRVAGLGSVEVVRCDETRDGLVVQGHVAAEETVTGVLVAPGDPEGAGLAVSAGFAASAGKLGGAGVGDFVVTLPWASRRSTFAIIEIDSFGRDSEAFAVGPLSSCPEESDVQDLADQAPAGGAESSTQSPS